LLTGGPRNRPLTLSEFSAALAGLAHFETAPFLALAVSGGADSLALAILADRWARERGGQTCALTVDHQLRPESGAESRLVGEWLSARGIRHEVLAWSGAKPGTGIQEAARIARYRLLAGWCRAHGYLHLLTAHHREDQIETHLIRRRAQSGPDGLAGMSAIRELRDCRLLRPLLGVSKLQLLAFLESENQRFITDPSNLDPAFERSRFRTGGDAMPQGPDLLDLLDAILTFGSERVARQREANATFARFVSVHPAGFAVLDPALARIVAQDLAEVVLSALASTIGGGAYPARRQRVARLRVALGQCGPRGHTLGGCRFVRWRKRVLVMRELARAALPIQLEPGASTFFDGRYEVSLPPAGDHALTVGYLGSAKVPDLDGLTLNLKRACLLKRSCLPGLLLPVLPAAWDDDGIAVIPHLGYRRERLPLFPRFVFRPPNPLTRADFAVV
jgi:tRNA(Ile)-lysidine synthase